MAVVRKPEELLHGLALIAVAQKRPRLAGGLLEGVLAAVSAAGKQGVISNSLQISDLHKTICLVSDRLFSVIN